MSNSKFQNITELIKVLIWPFIVLFVIGIYYSDVKRLIRNSSKLSIASFSMEIRQEASSQGFENLADLILDLKGEEVRALLTFAESGRIGLVGRNNDDYFLTQKSQTYNKLEEYGLVEFQEAKLHAIESYMISLGGKKQTVYSNNSDSWSEEKRDDFQRESYIINLPKNNVSKEDSKKLENYTVSLTDKGWKSIDIIINTVAEQLKK